MKIIDEISQLINDYNGIFTFCLHTDIDESIYDELSKELLDRVDSYSVKNKCKGISYLKSLSITNSAFEFNSSDIISQKDFTQDKRIIQTISDSCSVNNNVVIWKNLLKSGTIGNTIMEYSACVFEIINGKMSLKKSRFSYSYGLEYKDIDMLSYTRDIKINQILK